MKKDKNPDAAVKPPKEPKPKPEKAKKEKPEKVTPEKPEKAKKEKTKKEKAPKNAEKKESASPLLAKFRSRLQPKKKEKAPAVRLKPRQNPLTALKHFTIGRKHTPLTTIEIDAAHSAIHFYTMVGGDRSTLTHTVRNYAGGLFDVDFFTRFKLALREFVSANPFEGIRKVTLVVPDTSVMTDAIKVPNMRGIGKTGRNLPHAMAALYGNVSELRQNTKLASQNRQHTTYAVMAIQKYIVTSLYAACSENGMLVDTLTFHAAATVGGAAALCPKQKSASYLLLDIKDTGATYAFVANGRVTGTYTLPFGAEFLRKAAVTQEDMLFDHSYAELAVLNAREKAKSKKLTVMSIDGSADDEDDLELEETIEGESTVDALTVKDDSLVRTAKADGEAEEEEDEAVEDTPADEVAETAPKPQGITPKLFTRKAPRRLPKFMQRPVPETPEAVLDENFRVFVKWALTLIASNEKLTDIAKPEFVCVNLPAELASAVDRANVELEENGIPFLVLPFSEADKEIALNLSLFGGFFSKQLGTAGKF